MEIKPFEKKLYLSSPTTHGDEIKYIVTIENKATIDLENVDLRGAFLEGAILPDGFSSPDVKEQTAHLKSMNIKGLLI